MSKPDPSMFNRTWRLKTSPLQLQVQGERRKQKARVTWSTKGDILEVTLTGNLQIGRKKKNAAIVFAFVNKSASIAVSAPNCTSLGDDDADEDLAKLFKKKSAAAARRKLNHYACQQL